MQHRRGEDESERDVQHDDAPADPVRPPGRQGAVPDDEQHGGEERHQETGVEDVRGLSLIDTQKSLNPTEHPDHSPRARRRTPSASRFSIDSAKWLRRCMSAELSCTCLTEPPISTSRRYRRSASARARTASPMESACPFIVRPCWSGRRLMIQLYHLRLFP